MRKILSLTIAAGLLAGTMVTGASAGWGPGDRNTFWKTEHANAADMAAENAAPVPGALYEGRNAYEAHRYSPPVYAPPAPSQVVKDPISMRIQESHD